MYAGSLDATEWWDDAASAVVNVGRQESGANYIDGEIFSPTIHNRALSLPEIQQLASPDPMLGGLIQPFDTTNYSFPISTGPPPTRKSNIFKSRIIRGVAC